MKELMKTKIIPLLLTVAILVPVSFLATPPKKAQAIPVWDFVASAWQTYGLPALTLVGKQLAISMVQIIVSETVRWIDSGFQGNPAFISNPSKFLANAGDQAIGDYIFNNPDLRFLCTPFQIQVKLALGWDYQPFRKRINCTLSGVLKNAQGAYNQFVGGDFIGGGGWDSWFQMSMHPQDTLAGSYIQAKIDMDLKIGDKKLTDVTGPLNWSGGALDFKKCTETKYKMQPDPSGADGYTEVVVSTSDFTGSPLYRQPDNTSPAMDDTETVYTKTDCKTTTPGAIIANKLGFADTSGQRVTELQTTVENGVNAIISALLNQLVQQAVSKLKDGLLGGSSGQTVDYNALLQQQLSSYQSQLNSVSQNYNQMVQSSTNSSSANNSGSLDQARATAVSVITNMISNQNQYLSDYNQAASTYNAATVEFQRAKVCYENTGNNQDILTASHIRANVLENIASTTIFQNDVDRTLAPTLALSPNLFDVNQYIGITQNNIQTLNSALYTVNNAQDLATINSQASTTETVASSSKSTSGIQNYINSFLTSAKNQYSTTACPINASAWIPQ
jgi:hypothetical protein